MHRCENRAFGGSWFFVWANFIWIFFSRSISAQWVWKTNGYALLRANQGMSIIIFCLRYFRLAHACCWHVIESGQFEAICLPQVCRKKKTTENYSKITLIHCVAQWSCKAHPLSSRRGYSVHSKVTGRAKQNNRWSAPPTGTEGTTYSKRSSYTVSPVRYMHRRFTRHVRRSDRSGTSHSNLAV